MLFVDKHGYKKNQYNKSYHIGHSAYFYHIAILRVFLKIDNLHWRDVLECIEIDIKDAKAAALIGRIDLNLNER